MSRRGKDWKWRGVPAYLGGELPSQIRPRLTPNKRITSFFRKIPPRVGPLPPGVKVLTDVEISAAFPGVPIKRS